MLVPARRVWLVGQAASNGVVAGAATAALMALVAPVGAAVTGALVGAVAGATIAVPGIRRRHLRVDDSGVTAVRNGYELHARWEDLSAFEQGRFAFVVPVTLLRLHDATVSGTGRRALSEKRLAKMRKAGADRCVQIGVYVDDPSSGDFGSVLRTHRPDLMPDR